MVTIRTDKIGNEEKKDIRKGSLEGGKGQEIRLSLKWILLEVENSLKISNFFN